MKKCNVSLSKKGKLTVKFLDGTPAPKKYLEKVQKLIDSACSAEEEFGLDELERFAQEYRESTKKS